MKDSSRENDKIEDAIAKLLLWEIHENNEVGAIFISCVWRGLELQCLHFPSLQPCEQLKRSHNRDYFERHVVIIKLHVAILKCYIVVNITIVKYV